MAFNRFWKAEVVYHDEGDRQENLSVHSSGLPHDPKAVEAFLRSHNFRNKNVSINNIRPVNEEEIAAGHPFIGQKNDNLFNAAGKQVNESHEVIADAPAPPATPAKS